MMLVEDRLTFGDLKGNGSLQAFVPVDIGGEGADFAEVIFVYEMDFACHPRLVFTTGGLSGADEKVTGRKFTFFREGDEGGVRVEVTWSRGHFAESRVVPLETTPAVPAERCVLDLATAPGPGTYVRKTPPPALVLTVPPDCPGIITITDARAGRLLSGSPQAFGRRVVVTDGAPGGCWAYEFSRSGDGGVTVKWASDQVPEGKAVAPDCAAIGGRFSAARQGGGAAGAARGGQ